MSKIPVYFMPGLAASTTIFERIEFPEDTFEIFYWNGKFLLIMKL